MWVQFNLKIMKTLLGILLLMLTASILKAQGTLASIPTPVMQSFTALYPNVKDVAWNYNEPIYEARFKVRNKGMLLMFDESGTISETKNEIPVVDLPATVTKFVETNYKGWRVVKALHVVVNDEPYHEAYLQKGTEEVTLVFDRNAFLLVTVLPLPRIRVVNKEPGQ
jgi:hypothetical protein